MIQVSSWEDNDIMKKEVKSCDNHDLGEIQEASVDYLMLRKGSRVLRVPKSSVATFDGEKLYLRATEAEVYAGIYPFVDTVSGRSQTGDTNRSQMGETSRSQLVDPNPPQRSVDTTQ